MMPIPKRRALANGGFTLLELMVAFVILVIGVVAVLEAISFSLTIVRSSANRTQAVFLAQKELEGLLLSHRKEPLTVGQQSGDFEEPYSAFGWRSDVVDIGFGEMKKVTVIVNWMDGTVAKEYTLDTLVGPYTLSSPPPIETADSSTGVADQ